MVDKPSSREAQTMGQDVASKKILWIPNFNMKFTWWKERPQNTFGIFGSVNTNTPPQEENLYGEETSYEKKTAQKEIPSPWIGAPMEMTTAGGEGRRGGEMKHPGNTRFHVHVLSSQSTMFIFPGLRELLTKTSGDIIRKFPELSQHGRGAMSLMQQVNSWALQKMIYSHSTTLPSFQKIMSTSLCYLYCPGSRISQSCVCCGCWPQTFCVCMKQSKFFTLFFLIGLKSKKIQQNDRWLSFWCYPP